MFIPTKIFGREARPKPGMAPSTLATITVAGVEVEVLRYEISHFEIDGGFSVDGHFRVYRVRTASVEEQLQQQGSVFYTAGGEPPPGAASDDLPEGDGRGAPKWHKGDRSWPIRGGVLYPFVGQGYYEDSVVYLFARDAEPLGSFAAFVDDVERQDADEHDRLEEENGL